MATVQSSTSNGFQQNVSIDLGYLIQKNARERSISYISNMTMYFTTFGYLKNMREKLSFKSVYVQ